MILILIGKLSLLSSYHLLSLTFDFKNIGLFVFFKEFKLLKEFTPNPPKVKTGIFSYPSLLFASSFDSNFFYAFESKDYIFIGDYRFEGVSNTLFSYFFCNSINISSI